jgi:hypothetical protein
MNQCIADTSVTTPFAGSNRLHPTRDSQLVMLLVSFVKVGGLIWSQFAQRHRKEHSMSEGTNLSCTTFTETFARYTRWRCKMEIGLGSASGSLLGNGIGGDSCRPSSKLLHPVAHFLYTLHTRDLFFIAVAL